MMLTPAEVQAYGLKLMGANRGKKSDDRMRLEFHKHFGSSPLDLADMWYDLCYYDPTVLTEKEKTMKGFKRYLAAHYWLWARPKNSSMMASRFGMGVDYCEGKHLWKWIERIANLSAKKIVWDENLDSKDTEIFAISSDGVDFKLWEKKHPTLPFDTKNHSHEFKGCAAKYIIALSVFRSKCVFIAGPHKGSVPDLDTFVGSGLMEKLQNSGKVAIVDRGFKSKVIAERERLSLPDPMDSKELGNFKSRARLRQETYNRRLKHFEALGSTFKNGFEKHGIALRAVATTVQYQMDNGSPIHCA